MASAVMPQARVAEAKVLWHGPYAQKGPRSSAMNSAYVTQILPPKKRICSTVGLAATVRWVQPTAVGLRSLIKLPSKTYKKGNSMKLQVALGLMLSGISSLSMAAVSAEEAAKLGDTLTRVGAIAAGNEAGTIPAYEGGLRTAPPGFEPDSGVWVDPFADEEPLFRITAENMAEHADKLSDGQKEVLKRNPDYYMDIYPTHRTAAYPEEVLQATVRNATECETKKDGLAVETDCRGGIPFPIPQTGNEVMWNQLLRYNDGKFGTTTSASNSWIIDSNAGVTMASQQATFTERPFYQVDIDGRDPMMAFRTYSITKQPARKAGELTGLIDYLDPTAKPRRAWSYTPGQRRVKLAPEFAYDTPVASMGGLELFDELFMFSGVQDRFDFKLVGKKEMYIPYNSYKFYFDCKDQLQ